MTEDLVMNPLVDLHIHPAPEAYPIDLARVQTISVKCPVRGRGLVIRDLTRDASPALFAFFGELLTRGGELELDSDAAPVEALVELGFLLPASEIVDWPQFHIPLPDAALVPGDWIVSPDFLYQPAFALHPGVRWPADYDEQDGRLRCFAPGPACWVGDPASFTSPYWLTDAQAALLAPLTPGAPAALPPDLTASLVAVGALVPRHAPDALARFTTHHDDYRRDGYAIARALLPTAELAALRRYYAALLDAGLIQLGDRQNADRHSTYNDPIGRFVHARLAPIMAAIAGEPVLPSFSYYFSYLPGAALEPHKDRAQAEFSISLQLDHAPTPTGETGWPLCFTFDDGRPAAANLALGDAVLYHGRALTHHRPPLPTPQRSSILVLEYVPSSFDGLLI